MPAAGDNTSQTAAKAGGKGRVHPSGRIAALFCAVERGAIRWSTQLSAC